MTSVSERNSKFRSILAALSLSVALGVGVWAPPTTAEIFKWKDGQGRLHFAQDLNQVPARYREQARGAAFEEGTGSVIQRYDPVPAASAPRKSPSYSEGPASDTRAGKVYRVRVQKTGSTMRVNVRINDSVLVPFFVDTGASDVVLPERFAQELGLDTDGARTAIYGTANGMIQQALVTLDSVELGGARVEKVPASISKTMSTGLLGLSFFNHFRYRFDPVSGIITLEPNGLVEAGKIRGGRSAEQWRNQFVGLDARRRGIEKMLDEINPNWSRRKAELADAISEVDRQIAVLEDEADEARVPMQWRD